jgi:hypothetical protein
MLKLAVFISCDDQYVPLAIVALANFVDKNPSYDRYIIGTEFTADSKTLAAKHATSLIEVDLRGDFIDLDKRPYGQKYPAECFYHFYGYKALSDYDFIVNIEPDVYTNRRLDIDLETVTHIAGGYKNNLTISKFPALSKNLKQLQNNFGALNAHQLRILGGVRIYNVKGLQKVNFYETIVDYYQRSLLLGIPRCGDDSLMVFYQALNPTHVKTLGPMFNFIGNFDLDRVPQLYYFHFCNSTQKPWSSGRPRFKADRYFTDRYIEFVYNHFDADFIRCYLPTLYVDISSIRIPFYYYHRVNNFGDLITKYFLEKFCAPSTYTYDFTETNKPKIISCGSIMRLCNTKTIVYGSGIRDRKQAIKRGHIEIVRGPITRKRLQEIGCFCPPVYGDPALLLPLYYQPSVEKKYELGIIPHHIHYERVKTLYGDDPRLVIINLLNDNIEHVIDEIVSCKATISSSLHGLIASDAYGIPNKWIRYDNHIKGDNTKYYDYFASVNRQDGKFIDALGFKFLSVDEILSQIGPVNINYDAQALRDRMFFDERGIKPWTQYLYHKISTS